MKEKPIEYGGVIYPSRKALCEAFGIDRKLLTARLFRGWTVEQAMETGLGEKVREGNPVVYQGTSFPSVKALSNALELPYSSLSHLYGRLQDIEKAVERCMEMPEREVVLWGKVYASYSQVALAFGLNGSVVLQRVREGNELEDVVKDALSKEPITLYGEVYQNFVDLCAAYKIQPSNAYERLRYGMSLEDAVTRPVKEVKHGEPVEYRGKTYPSKVALCREYGLSANCVYEQLDTNPITFMESFEILCRLKARAKIPQDEAMNYIPRCRARGENYKTVYEFVYQFGITAGTVYTYKSRHQCADLFEALRGMQGERRTAYPVDGKILFGIEVRKQYGQAQLKKVQDQKIEVPRYPSLQEFDFQTECYDTMAIYYELLEELKQEKKLGEGMEQEENVELGGLSL